MKKSLLCLFVSLTICLSLSTLKAQNQEYWREGFEPSPVIGTACDLITTSPTANGGSYFNGNSGVWYGFNVYRTTGTGCPAGNNHVRYKNISGVTDSGYLVTPVVNFGIKEFHFLRARASRSHSIYVTTDTLATTTNWTLVATTPSTAGTGICIDTTVMINSATARRLKIIARPGTDTDIDSLWITSFSQILPVKFTNVSSSKTNGLAKIIWNIEAEINAANYVVERSIDGTNFTAIGSIDATNAGKYSFIDAATTNASSYYRIKAVDKDGSFAYSAVVFTVADTKTAAVTVYPNPITNKQVNVQLSNLSKGNYNIEVYNNLGQAILSKAIQFDGGTSSLSLQLPVSINAGLYRLSLINSVTKINKIISVQ